MKCSPDSLFTPLYLKVDDEMKWPENEKVFHLLSRDGLFICRNNDFYRSCAPARNWPGELASQKPFIELKFPRIPRVLIERIVGFFSEIAEKP